MSDEHRRRPIRTDHSIALRTATGSSACRPLVILESKPWECMVAFAMSDHLCKVLQTVARACLDLQARSVVVLFSDAALADKSRTEISMEATTSMWW